MRNICFVIMFTFLTGKYLNEVIKILLDGFREFSAQRGKEMGAGSCAGLVWWEFLGSSVNEI